jgi:hypothetical protein
MENDELVFNTNHIEFHTFSDFSPRKIDNEIVLNFEQTRPIALKTDEHFYVSIEFRFRFSRPEKNTRRNFSRLNIDFMPL